MTWMERNLDAQGYCLSADESHTNFCLPSTLLALWSRRRGTVVPRTQPS